MSKLTSYLLTAVIAAAAIASILVMYSDYLTNPWTRDSQVRAVWDYAGRVGRGKLRHGQGL